MNRRSDHSIVPLLDKQPLHYYFTVTVSRSTDGIGNIVMSTFFRNQGEAHNGAFAL